MPKPIIGINCDLKAEDPPEPRLTLKMGYVDAALQAGGLPILIPFLDDPADIGSALAMCDGLLLTGGRDLDPSSFGRKLSPQARLAPARRRRFDQLLAKAALQRDMPVLCICMGMQLINLAAGGALIQDIETERAGSLQHRNPEETAEAHAVNVTPGSHLARIVGTEPLGVNSTHHQAVGDVAPGFRASAHAEDGLVEAIESIAADRVVGVQWHPERMLHNPRHSALFQWLVEQAGIRHGV